ncbi:MAG TPA: response regulator transcription factor [Actinocrinis sp.]|jgi:DNA-binding NarL/FixJ family response regulator
MNDDSPAAAPLRIIVADDQASVREGLVLLLGGLPGIEVVASAADGQAALDLVAEHRPDVILLDLHMPVLDGIETTRRLTAEHPQVAIVVLTTYLDDTSVLDALHAGARSYLTKDADHTEIASALRSAAEGLAVLDTRVHDALLNAATRTDRDRPAAGSRTQNTAQTRPRPGPEATQNRELPDGLTEREAEILGLIAEGLNNPEIAARLYVTTHTVKSHINRIFAKTGSRDRAAAIRYAHQHGLD